MYIRKKIKRLEALLLTSSIVLCSCYGSNNTTANEVTTTTQSQEADVTEIPATDNEAINDESKVADIQELQGILDNIEETVEIGTAGSSLRAVIGTVPLMNWAVKTQLTSDDIKSTVTEWLDGKKMDQDKSVELSEQFLAVKSTYQLLLKKDQEELLESAGCGDAPYPWSTEPLEPVEVLMETLEQNLSTGGE